MSAEEQPGDGPEVLFGGTGHEDCSPQSPCHQDPSGGTPVPGIRGVFGKGEVWLARADVLHFLSATLQAYHDAAHKASEQNNESGRAVAGIAMQVVDMLGAQLYSITEPSNAIPTDVPDSLEGLMEGWNAEPAAESPIEAAIRKAKEAAEQARQSKAQPEEGQ